MHEDDAVALALLRISRRDEEGNPQPGNAESRGGGPEPRNHAPGQRIKTLRAGKLEPLNNRLSHSNAILNAAVVAHGAKKAARTSIAASKDRCPPTSSPAIWASTAPAPKISAGM